MPQLSCRAGLVVVLRNTHGDELSSPGSALRVWSSICQPSRREALTVSVFVLCIIRGDELWQPGSNLQI